MFSEFLGHLVPALPRGNSRLIDLANRYKDRLQIVGVSLDDESGDVKQFVKDAGINYPVVMAGREIVAEYGGVPALPTLFVVNPDGNVVQKHEGLYSNASL